MRIALLSDIHSNLEALEAVLRKCAQLHLDDLWCLGDIVGYGADPLACIQLVKKNCSLIVKGNHDAGAAASIYPSNFNEAAQMAISWTREQLSEDNILWLGGLPRYALRYGCLAFHASLTGQYGYITTQEMAEKNISLLCQQYPEARCGFFGHTHIGSYYQSPKVFQSVYTAGT
jgi:predicted phosphodiesterase